MPDEAIDLGDVGPLPNFADSLGIASAAEPMVLTAFPEEICELGLELGAILAEWSLSLDPVAALRDSAQEHLIDAEQSRRDQGLSTEPWIVSTPLEPRPECLTWLRHAAKDEGVI